ncbi:MAG: hypothetical protein MUO75_08050 [Actinobacteria bacterium]|nr:hypothetical protein [Actinomycetota bacterium]
MAEESEPEVAKPRSRRWLTVIILALAVAAAGLTFFLLYRAMDNERKVREPTGWKTDSYPFVGWL